MSSVKLLLLLFVIAISITTCKKNDTTPPAILHPLIATQPVTNVGTTTATGGGIIQDNGGGAITASGICWSSTNMQPVITDNNIPSTATEGSFTVNITNLNPHTTYYVRAYATNSAGTAYGTVAGFLTGSVNAAPEARNITVFGTMKVGEPIVARYIYFDAENNTENGTTFQWYVANDANGAGATAITNTNDSNFTIRAADQNKYLQIGITPRAASGTTNGTEAKSTWMGPIGAADPTTVTFTYNGQQVTYGIITSALTHRKWLDRNLGAPNTPTGPDDWQNKGDLFQWGRKADGHQLITRGATTPATTAVNGTTTTLATTEITGHSQFIITSSAPFDWINPQNGDLWKQTGGTNNVCPTGWHVPTKTEWEAEQLGTVQDAYNKLNVLKGGIRNFNNGTISATTISGYYWTSTVFTSGTIAAYSFHIGDAFNNGFTVADIQSNGESVRCIKD
jgi:hypothetical protein